MEKTLQELYSIRELARRKDENERTISQFRSQLQNKQSLKELKDENHKTKLGKSGYIIVFVVLYILSAVILNKVFTIIMLMADSGFSFADAFKASADININPIIGMAFAIPVALIITVIVRAVIKTIDKRKNRENSIENQNSRKMNQQIIQNNVSADISNSGIMEQIAACEQTQQQLLQELRNTAPWYPEIYFTVPAVEYIIQQLETGKADSVNQAIVHYEAMDESEAFHHHLVDYGFEAVRQRAEENAKKK